MALPAKKLYTLTGRAPVVDGLVRNILLLLHRSLRLRNHHHTSRPDFGFLDVSTCMCNPNKKYGDRGVSDTHVCRHMTQLESKQFHRHA